MAQLWPGRTGLRASFSLMHARARHHVRRDVGKSRPVVCRRPLRPWAQLDDRERPGFV